MRKDRIGSVASKARAALKEALGLITGDRRLQAEGAAERMASQPRIDVGAARGHPQFRTRKRVTSPTAPDMARGD